MDNIELLPDEVGKEVVEYFLEVDATENTDTVLATIEIIERIDPHPNADAIEIAIILGYDVIVKKDEFKAGQHVIYYRIDSLLPVRPEFEFLRDSCYKRLDDGAEGFRLKAKKIRGVVSMGLVMPIHSAFNIAWSIAYPHVLYIKGNPESRISYEVGNNVTSLLNVKKYIPPVNNSNRVFSGNAKGNFPEFIRKTDVTRYENIGPRYYDQYKAHKYFVTVKKDGSSLTCYIKDGEFGVCSRNLELKRPEEGEKTSDFWNAVINANLEFCLRKYHEVTGKNVALQAEMIGPSIQSNFEKVTYNQLRLFDVFDIDHQRYMTNKEYINFCDNYLFNYDEDDEGHFIAVDEKYFGLVEQYFSEHRKDNLDDDIINNPFNHSKAVLKDFVNRTKPEDRDGYIEGIVWRSYDNQTRFKIINDEYELKRG